LLTKNQIKAIAQPVWISGCHIHEKRRLSCDSRSFVPCLGFGNDDLRLAARVARACCRVIDVQIVAAGIAKENRLDCFLKIRGQFGGAVILDNGCVSAVAIGIIEETDQRRTGVVLVEPAPGLLRPVVV
jgi:hypothetical protein